jgi:hypothetical protein
MKVTILGVKYLVRFSHDTKKLRQTEAYLFKVPDEGEDLGEPLLLSLALCHYKDNFQRKAGRKIAFTRLLKAMEDSELIPEDVDKKKIRAELWKVYFENFKK